MRIFREKPGILANRAVWVAVEPGYLYTSDTLIGLLLILCFERKNDKHLAG